MTACCVWNASNAAAGGGGGGLDTTVTISSAEFYDDPSLGGFDAFGYALGVDYLSLINFGSIGSTTYTDGASNSRTVSAIYYTESAPSSNGDDLYFCLNATGITNSDNTFVSIDYDGENYTRASATYTSATGSCTTWRWLNITPNGPTTGTVDFVVNI